MQNSAQQIEDSESMEVPLPQESERQVVKMNDIARNKLLRSLYQAMIKSIVVQFLICSLYLVSFGQNLAVYQNSSPRYFFICHMLFNILEVIFLCLIICHDRETSIIRWHLAIMILISISISVWGINQKISMQQIGIEGKNFGNAEQMEALEWTERLFGVIVYIKALVTGFYTVFQLVFRIYPLYFVKIFKIDMTEVEDSDTIQDSFDAQAR